MNVAKQFRQLCSGSTLQEPLEHVEKPVNDWIQEAWLQVLSGDVVPVLPAETPEELHEKYEPHAGYIVNCYRNRVLDTYRQQKGQKNSPRKRELMERAFSLDGFDADGTAWSELIEDVQGEIPFRRIEDVDELVSTIKRIPPQHQNAVKRFMMAFFLQEAGYELPRSVIKRLSIDRKQTGLPLVLSRGPRKGRG